MKRFILFSFILLSFAACKKSSTTDDTTYTTSTDPAPVTTNLVNTTWRITTIVRNGTDYTSSYASYKLTFAPNGVLVGANDLLSKRGSWTVTTEGSKTKLTMGFQDEQAIPDMSAVSQDWIITSRTAKTLVMQHTSGSGTDSLTIEKV